MGDDVLRLCKSHNTAIETTSDSFDILSAYLLRAEIEDQKIRRAKLLGEILATMSVDPLFQGLINDTLPPIILHGQKTHSAELSIGNLIAKFTTARTPSWKPKTSLEFERIFRLVKEWFGANRIITTLTTADIGAYRDMLVRIPKHYNCNGHAKNISLKDAVENSGNKVCILPQTAEKYLNLTKVFLKWCVEEGHLDKMPCDKIGIKYSVSDKGRYPFDDEQLTRLFKSPIWTGCKSKGKRASTGALILKDAHYWVPLLGVFTGMRCGEI